MAKFLKVITWARWKVMSSLEAKYYTVFTVSVFKPSWEFPIACVAMSQRSGINKSFMRFLTLESLQEVFVIPEIYKERLIEGYAQAVQEAREIQTKQKTLWKMSDMAPGTHVVRTDTGEIIAEAERIIRGDNDARRQC